VNTYADRTGMSVCTSCVATSASPVASVTIWNCTCNAGYKGPTYEDVVSHDNFARSCGGMRSSACMATQSSTLTT
jgi:ribosomal protein L37AE/L43A